MNRLMELITFLLGWMAIILMMAAPLLVPLIIIQIFFGGAAAFVKGVASGHPGNIVFALADVAIAIAGAFYYLRWNGIGTEIAAQTEISFVDKALTPDMLKRPRVWHGRFASGPNGGEIVDLLMRSGKIDQMVGDRRFLPLKRETKAPHPGYWDETFRLTLKMDRQCEASQDGHVIRDDACFTIEPISGMPREPHFGFGMASRVNGATETLYFQSAGGTIAIATCHVRVARPFFPTIHQVLEIVRAIGAVKTGKMRVGDMSPHDRKELDELRKCRTELLRQFAELV